MLRIGVWQNNSDSNANSKFSLSWVEFFETAYRVQPYPYFYQPVSSFKNGYNFSTAADEHNVYYCFQAF